MPNKKQDSWKNAEMHRKGKARLKNAVLQHPDDDPKTSIFDYLKKNTRRNLWVIPYERFIKGDK
jgi:hypothetical protein